MSTEAREAAWRAKHPEVARSPIFDFGWDARGEAIKDDPRIPEVNKAWVFDPEGMKAATDEVRTGRRRVRGQVTPDREAMILTVAKQMGGWNDDTSEPTIQDEHMRRSAEAHWEKVNRTCLKEAAKYVDAILALFNEKGNESCQHDSFDSRALPNGALRQTCNDCGLVCDIERAD